MTAVGRLDPVFVDTIPADDALEPGKLYISILFTTTVHLCASGCGFKVVLPLNPAQYRIEFDGVNVSMAPSVGNWDYPCRWHYWIRRGQVIDAGPWSNARIENSARNDERALDLFFDESQFENTPSAKSTVAREFFTRFSKRP